MSYDHNKASSLERAFRVSEDNERAEASRVIGAVRHMAVSAEEENWRSRLLDVLDGYDRARKRTNEALEAWTKEIGL